MKDQEFRSESVPPGGEAWIIIGVPDGFVPVKENPRITPDIAARFTVLGLGDLSAADIAARTAGKCRRGGWLRVRNDSASPATFACVFRFDADTTALERKLGQLFEGAWREGTRRGNGTNGTA